MKRRRKGGSTEEDGAAPLRPEAARSAKKGKLKKTKRMRKDDPREERKVAQGAAQDASCDAPLKNSFVPTRGAYTFEPDPMDHCETDRRAYRHLKPVLLRLERAVYGKNAGELRIWDPYYCDGAIKGNLAALGFPKVHNENEDFYEVLRTSKLPEHDVLVTSPPYSQDHLERCMQHCASSAKPWCALLPNWVFGKDFYQEFLRTAPTMSEHPPIYLGPAGQSYQYWFPQGASQRPEHVGQDGGTTPYKTSWFICLPSRLGGSGLLEHLQDKRRGADWVVAKTVRGLKWLAQKAAARGGGGGSGRARAKAPQPQEAAKGALPQAPAPAAGVAAKSKGAGLKDPGRDAQKLEKRPRQQGGLEVVPQQAAAANALSFEAVESRNALVAARQQKKKKQRFK